MELSNELVSQFAKLATSNDRTDKESSVYGTVKVYENKKYIQLDGSEILTPIQTDSDTLYSTAYLEDGDRVTASIKNHNLVVTGNTSVPSNMFRESTTDEDGNTVTELVPTSGKISDFEIVVADMVTTDYVDAKFANIDNLVSENATIKNLEADIIETNELIAQEITARKAAIEELEAGQIKVEDLDAKYATIDSLSATDAVIDTLKTDIADIDTLIFGSASGTTIQTSFANAVITQLGKAQIESAMIISLDASQITAGDIITNNVRVMSEDGSLLISDETIQISDDNRVRVQIGKDASNDYSINIWDVDGNLMFSKGGITDSAIKDAIIRNDMVAEDANIEASKLDISSLFTEINDSTETINANKVLVDTDSGTVDIAFKQMQTDISELSDDVSSQGTELSVVQGYISSKIWSQDIDTATNGLNTKIETLNTKQTTLEQTLGGLSATVSSHTTEISNKADSSEVTKVSDKVTSLEQNLEGFHLTVSNTYATKNELSNVEDELSNIEIGGRNLIPLSSVKKSSFTMDAKSTNDITISGVASDGTSVMYIDKLYEPGVYTLNATGSTSGKYFRIISSIELDGFTYNSFYDGTFYRPYYKDVTLPLTMTFTESAKIGFVMIHSYGNQTISGLKLEKGNKATDWTPAIEDQPTHEYIDNAISNIEIGARNLLVDGMYNVSSSDDWTNITMSDYSYYTQFGSSARLEAGQTYTFSIYIDREDESDVIPISYSIGIGTMGNYQRDLYYSPSYIPQGQRLVYTFTFEPLESDTRHGYEYFAFRLRNEKKPTTLRYRRAKLEQGNKATDWTPAPEDGMVEIGGKNLYLGTKSFTGDAWKNISIYTEDGSYNGLTVFSRSAAWGGATQVLSVIAGEIYTFSFYAKAATDLECEVYVTSGTLSSEASCTARYLSFARTKLTTDWVRYSCSFEILTSGAMAARVESITNGQYWICGLKLERGNKATDWTPAPEDMATNIDLDSVKNSVDVHTKAIADLNILNDEISMNVSRVEEKITTSVNDVVTSIETLSNEVAMKMTSEAVKIEIQSELANGVTRVSTETGYTFDDSGMTVARSGSEMKTQITDNGMTVYQNEEPTLTANNVGVGAKNLHATTYLIVGEYSRFEDYGGRTGCFWIGE